MPMIFQLLIKILCQRNRPPILVYETNLKRIYKAEKFVKTVLLFTAL